MKNVYTDTYIIGKSTQYVNQFSWRSEEKTKSNVEYRCINLVVCVWGKPGQNGILNRYIYPAPAFCCELSKLNYKLKCLFRLTQDLIRINIILLLLCSLKLPTNKWPPKWLIIRNPNSTFVASFIKSVHLILGISIFLLHSNFPRIIVVSSESCLLVKTYKCININK